MLPLARAGLLSLQSWDGISPPRWVGIDNYVALTRDRVFWSAVANTGSFTVATAILQVGLALLVASALTGNIRGRAALRALFLMPFVVSGAISGLIWGMLLEPNFGALNVTLRSIGLELLARPWLSDTSTVIPSLVVVWVWQSFGFYVIILFAALDSLPRDVQEAASMDGANAFQRLRLITIPLLRPTITVCLTLSLISGLQAFDQIWMMTGGGPNHASETLGTYLYKLAFGGRSGGGSEFGYAASIAVIIFALSMISSAVLMQRRNRRDLEHEG